MVKMTFMNKFRALNSYLLLKRSTPIFELVILNSNFRALKFLIIIYKKKNNLSNKAPTGLILIILLKINRSAPSAP